jgi:hypothetical protein
MFLLINIHHNKAATATLCQQLSVREVDATLFSGTLAIEGTNKRFNQYRGTVYSVAPDKNARSCIYIRNHINALPLLEFCSRDATTVRITYTYRGFCEELIVASSYLTYDSD